MKLTKIYSAAIHGIDARAVTVETAMERGATVTIVGLPDKAVQESYTRIVAAIRSSGCQYPHHRIVINLSPADVRKEGASFDLPMALGVLSCAGVVTEESLAGTMVTGELSLDGSVLPVKGALPMAILARSMGLRRLIVPADNAVEAAVVNDLEVIGVRSLSETLALLKEEPEAPQPTVVNTRELFARNSQVFDCDFAEVKGQEAVKRAIEIACAGGHNILMSGSPGSGKSMMAKRIPTILPPLTLREALETTKVHSVAGKLKSGSMLMTHRPFRMPHHTVSPVAMVGGGSTPQPGEISLADHGILYLDEFPEFPRTVLEVLRQPLEDREITVSRSKYSVTYPASFMLVASMNPCPCGYYGHPRRRCTCPPGAVQKYMSRISGPLMDRIDLQIEIQPVEFDDMASRRPGLSSAEMRADVEAARHVQQVRFTTEKGVFCNAQMNSRLLRKYAWPDPAGLERLKQRMEALDMSARAFDRILRVARTIADLEAVQTGLTPEQAATTPVLAHHISEAIGYRALDRASYGESF